MESQFERKDEIKQKNLEIKKEKLGQNFINAYIGFYV